MATSVGRQLTDSVIRLGLAGVLKQEGYRKSARTFRLVVRDHIRVVNVQGSPWYSGDSAYFFVNLGVYFPAVSELIRGFCYVPPGVPTEPNCAARTRLRGDHIMGGWELTPQTDLEVASEEVVAAWRDQGQPWMEEHGDLRTLLAHEDDASWGAWQVTSPFVIAAWVVLGEPERATARLRDWLDYDAPRRVLDYPEDRTKALSWAKGLGLEIPRGATG